MLDDDDNADDDDFFVGGEQHSADYKKAVVTYYLKNDNNVRDTCKIFGCHYQSLARWIADYKGRKTFERKTRKNHNLKINKNIEKFVINQIKKSPTITMWGLAKMVKNKFAIDLSDRSINNIFVKNNITRKKISSLTTYVPHRLSVMQKTKLDNLNSAESPYFIGYFSIYLNTPKKYGRSFRGKRVLNKHPVVPSLHFFFMYIIHGGKIIQWKCVGHDGSVLIEDLLYDFFVDKFAEKYLNKDCVVILFNKNSKIKSAYSNNVVVDDTKYLMKSDIRDIILKLKKQIIKSSPENENELRSVLSKEVK